MISLNEMVHEVAGTTYVGFTRDEALEFARTRIRLSAAPSDGYMTAMPSSSSINVTIPSDSETNQDATSSTL